MKLLFWSAFAAVVLALASCGRSGVQAEPASIAARVNGTPIAVEQVRGAIARNEVAPASARQAAAGALERLIDEELLAQAARDAGIESAPHVRQSLESARRRILARAYLDRAAGAATVEGHQAVGEFYRENPALFSQRRVYRVQELFVDAPRERLGDVKTASASAKNLDDVAGWLEAQGLPFRIVSASRPAESISLSVLPKVYEMHEGQIAVFAAPAGTSILQLVGSRPAPLTEQQAAPAIARYLLNVRRLEVARAEIEKLRKRAAIEYVGGFGAARAAAPAAPVATRNEYGSGGGTGRGMGDVAG